MNRIGWIVLLVALAACRSDPPVATHAGPIELWDPVDPSFAGCQGACGAHVDSARSDVVTQPGARVGQRTYCPVSGAVFEVDADHPHVEVGRRTLWFCCAACADYFRAHRDEVLRARGLDLAGAPHAESETSSSTHSGPS